MLKQTALFTSIATLAFLGSACGSDEGSSVSDGPGPGTSGTGGSISLGGGTGTGASGNGDGPHDGGTVDLTPDQVSAIEDSACAGWSTEGEALPAVLQLVVDVSLSMTRPAPGVRNQTKWDVTRDALSGAIDGLSAQTAVGVLYYPNRATRASTQARPVDQCVNVEEMVDIELLGAANSPVRAQLQESLTNAMTNGGTPTQDAYEYALENGMRPYVSSASKFMLLITDGQPTFAQGCLGSGNVSAPVDEQPIVDSIAAAFAEGIRTFVIGSPGSEENASTGADARPWLSRAATAGGTDFVGCSDEGPTFCHLDMTEEPDFAVALQEGLGEIAGQINSCTYAVPSPPTGQEIDMTKVNLIVTAGGSSELVLPDDTGDCSEGWQVNADDQIVLCSDTCARVQEDGAATVRLLFGCTAGVIDIPK